MIICERCKEAIWSRGETVVVDRIIDEYEIMEDALKCEWCEEEYLELLDVHFN